MLNIAFACPKCDQTTQVAFTPQTAELHCAHCDYELPSPEGAMQDGKLTRCLCCASEELFVRKDFSQRLGIAIIVVGFIIATIFWANYMHVATYITLFATALLDLALYFLVGNLLECYRCHAQYRGLPELEQYAPFSLEVHEKHRQQAIRLREAQQAAAAKPPSH
jgi:hypothetical protein